ncbi:MAG: response regulator [Spirochaetes bacterium]|nr:response regulator [Spirochaetota bacterium]MBU0954829.1 response regulator [Spirochaetota bacterium]
MAVSKEKFLALFLGEFRENLTVAENQIILLKNDPENTDTLTLLLRTLHTIKGSARMLQFVEIEKLVHGLETVFKGVREGRYLVDAKLARFFFMALDQLRKTADRIEQGQAEQIAKLDQFLADCEKICSNEAYDPSALELAPAADEHPKRGADAAQDIKEPVGNRVALTGLTATLDSPSGTFGNKPAGTEDDSQAKPAEAVAATQEHSSFESSIRVDGSTIDRSISLVNTMTIRQMRLRSGIAELDNMEAALTAAYRNLDDVKKMRKELLSVSRMLRAYKSQYSDQLFEIEHGTQELRESVVSMRMLPLSMILERFPRMVEDAASSLGKDVRLHISGDAVRLDRAVLNKLSDPLIHLVRNAVDHGIEPAEQRIKAGKPAHGNISIQCKTEGNRILVVVQDDGRGLDYAAIRERCLQLWPENQDEFKVLADSELIRYLYQPGFSTRKASTTLSGRGVGLDIVKSNIEAARGQILLESVSGQGCVFSLLLPVSASTMDGMFVESAGNTYYVPASSIARTLLLDDLEIFNVRQKEMFTLDGVNIALHDLGVCLQNDRPSERSGKIPVLLIHSTGQLAGLRVDRILGYDSLVYQNLPASLRKNPLVLGVVFDIAFDIIPILNMGAVLDRTRSVRFMDTRKRFSASAHLEKPTVLVVDDSISTREIEISMLSLEGYNVIGAMDGVDALEKIHAMHMDLIVSDLNMPRMDGLQLLENIKNDEALSQLPVILVTTVDDPEIRAKADLLGASRYILKSTFDQDNLIQAVRQLLLEREGRA